MTPAPGPFSTPIIVDVAGPASASSDGSGSSAAQLIGRGAAELSGERVPSASTTSQSVPKTCTGCGDLLESLGVITLGSRLGTTNTAPSPSSIAFATSRNTDASVSAAAETAGVADNIAGNVIATEIMHLESDRPQFCAVCLHARAQQQQQQQATISSNARLDAEGDSTMVDDTPPSPPPTRPSMHRSASTMDASGSALPREPAVSPTTPTHPWRRQAPWTIDRNRSSDATSPVRGEPQLTISTTNVGAGGDALDAVANVDEVEFPPLARSPSMQGSAFTATSPRIPLSPTRARGSYSMNPPHSPPALGRQLSFSRSQNAIQAGANAIAPVVNVPGRGRVRAGSSSGTCMPTALQSANRGRRTSTTRRLSRSSSSQGPTAVSFADLAVTAQGSALADEVILTEAIEEDPFGPRSMTRPRLSTMYAQQDVKKESAPSGHVSQRSPIDHRQKPFVASALRARRNDGEDDEQQGGKSLVWFDCSRPDPRLDISRIRSNPVGRGCLYPGATFRGTQKSGRTSYDVSVQIVNVDLAASHLCGYLNIRGLTDDWPELTTYFDAEIIGQRYGFLTGKWGATEADDMKHWGRFTPFRPIRSTLTRPGLRFNHMNKPYVFMRWKERFLVPDHRVRDISGASFAGFYYVCVELGEEANTVSQSLTSPASPVSSPGAPPTRGRSDTMDTGGFGDVPATAADAEGQAGGPFSIPDVSPSTSGRMSGFYFHEHSEPYQQLTLRHVFESSSSTFELR